MLNRIEITGFEIDTSTAPPSVKTTFKINQIDTTSIGPASGLSITNSIASTAFKASVVT